MVRRRHDVQALTVHRAGALALLLCSSCAAPPTVSWSRDVKPRLEASCTSCHSEGGGAPFSFTAPADAAWYAELMLDAVQTGRMPPSGVDKSGACGDFVGPRPFDDDDVAALAAWIEDGAPIEDDLDHADAPSPQDPPGRVVEFAPPPIAVPAGAIDEHRCFLTEQAPGALTGLRVTSDDGAPLHHVMLFAPRDPAAAQRARDLDDGDAAPGWPCEATPGAFGLDLVASWAAGEPVVTFPPDTGVPLPDLPLVVQVHTGARGGAARVALFVVDEVAHPLAFVPVALTGFTLPPGAARTVLEGLVSVPPTPGAVANDATIVHGVAPHLHARGRSLTLRTVGGLSPGEGTCIVDAKRYSSDRQEIAFFDAPLQLAAGAPLSLSCAWSTADDDAAVLFGEGADDEMCMVFLLVER